VRCCVVLYISLVNTGEQRQARAALEQEASELKGHITQLNTRLEAAHAQQSVAEAAQEEVILLSLLTFAITNFSIANSAAAVGGTCSRADSIHFSIASLASIY
jgi:hypothetical protein